MTQLPLSEARPTAPEELSAGQLHWRVHLARAEPGKAVGAVLGLVIAGAAVGALTGNPLLGLGASAVVTGSIAEFLFPIEHRLTEQGAEVRFGFSRSFISWQQVRRCYLLPDGLKLSPLPAAGRLEAFRGVFLRFDGNQDEVLAFVRQARHAAGQ